MGGAVSSGQNNDELIDNLMGSCYIRTRDVELAFRAVDRADYILPEFRDQAYKDLAWRSGLLHLSAPCIYSEVMEGLELRPGLSFLNVGSGTGYLSTMVGLVLGSGGINHGVEVYSTVVDYANMKLKSFMENSIVLDEFDFCEPKFFVGNGLSLSPMQAAYDRVYCGAACPEKYAKYFRQLIKVGGVLIMPLNDNLLQVRRESQVVYSSKVLLNVTFATLRLPQDGAELYKLDDLTPPRLEALARGRIRSSVQRAALSARPDLAPPTARPKPSKPRRICIPIDNDSDAEDLNTLHDLDRESGGNEMNALLSLVLSMGQHNVAGSIRFDSVDGSSSESEDSAHEEEPPAADPAAPAPAPGADTGPSPAPADAEPASPASDDEDVSMEDLISDTLRRAITGRLEPRAQEGTPAGRAARPPRTPRTPRTPRAPRSQLALSLHLDPLPARAAADADTPQHSQSEPGSTRRRRERKRHSQCSLDAEDKGEASTSQESAVDSKPGTSSSSSDDEAAPAADGAGAGDQAAAKRQKFDSGLGEDNSPSWGSSPLKNDATNESDTEDIVDSEESESEVEHVYVRDGRRAALSGEVRAQLARLPLPPPLARYVRGSDR